MRSNVSLEDGWRNLRQLNKDVKAQQVDWNEAQTRFQYIDRLITECLGWPRQSISPEPYVDGEYIDYALGDPVEAVWEAKREGVYFDVPADRDKAITQSLSAIFAVSKSAEAAIRQVQGYCNSLGVEIAVVCNGHQLIAFVAQRIGAPWLKGKALIIRDLEQLEREFATIWQCLSPDGLFEKRLSLHLGSRSAENIPAKLSTNLLRFPSFRYKTELQTNLRAISELLLEDVVRTEGIKRRFYNECYCETGALSRDALISQKTLQARYAALFPSQEEKPRLEPAAGADADLSLSRQILTEALAKRPIVLLGDVGVGKTSFLEDLMYVRASEEFSNAISLYIDLGSKAALALDIREFVTNEIERQLLQKYGVDVQEDSFVHGVYDLDVKRHRGSFRAKRYQNDQVKLDDEINRFLEDMVSDKPEHLKRSIDHLSKARKQQIVIIIDNADQRSEAVQQTAFIISQEFAQNWNALVFIAVWPTTFYQSKKSGALAAYPHKVFTILPPRPELVIEKRLVFALKIAEGKIPAEMLEGVRLNINTMATFLKALLHSLGHNRDLAEILSNITGGNIRQVVEFVTEFIGSPNVEAEKIVRIQQEEGRYTIPIHEFSKAAILGDYSHFNPESSLAMNMFEVYAPDSREHFLCPIIVAYLLSGVSQKDRENFVKTTDIVGELQSQGFLPQRIHDALRRLTNKHVIETTERVMFEGDPASLTGGMPEGFRATSVGAYHLRRWLGTFAYLDAMVFDTPIFEQDVKDQILLSLESFEIGVRYQRAVLFRSYLTRQWEALATHPAYFNWFEAMRQEEQTFTSVRRFLERGPRTPRRRPQRR